MHQILLMCAVLLFWIFLHYKQLRAQGVNLIAFLPMSVVALIIHIKNFLLMKFIKISKHPHLLFQNTQKRKNTEQNGHSLCISYRRNNDSLCILLDMLQKGGKGKIFTDLWLLFGRIHTIISIG